MLAGGARGRRVSAAALPPGRRGSTADPVKLGSIDMKAKFRIDGGVFTGKAMDGQPLSGKLESPDSTYVGSFIAGRRQGTGRIEYRNGDTYEGLWMNGGMVGDGRFTVGSDGTEYSGQFGIPRAALAALKLRKPAKPKPKFAWEGGGGEEPGSDDDDDDDEIAATELPPSLASTKGLAPLPEWEATRPADLPPFFDRANMLTGVGQVSWTDGRLFRGHFLAGRPICAPDGDVGTLHLPDPEEARAERARKVGRGPRHRACQRRRLALSTVPPMAGGRAGEGRRGGGRERVGGQPGAAAGGGRGRRGAGGKPHGPGGAAVADRPQEQGRDAPGGQAASVARHLPRRAHSSSSIAQHSISCCGCYARRTHVERDAVGRRTRRVAPGRVTESTARAHNSPSPCGSHDTHMTRG